MKMEKTARYLITVFGPGRTVIESETDERPTWYPLAQTEHNGQPIVFCAKPIEEGGDRHTVEPTDYNP